MRTFDSCLQSVAESLPNSGDPEYWTIVKDLALEQYRSQFGVFGKLVMPAVLLGLPAKKEGEPEWMSGGITEVISAKFKSRKERELVMRHTTKEERAAALLQYAKWKMSQ